MDFIISKVGSKKAEYIERKLDHVIDAESWTLQAGRGHCPMGQVSGDILWDIVLCDISVGCSSLLSPNV